MLYICLLINPLIAIIMFFYFVYKKNINISKKYLFLSLLLGVIGMRMPIIGDVDLIRHYSRYESIDTTVQITKHLQEHKDYFIYIVYYYGKKFAVKKEFMTFLFVFLGYFFFIKSFYIINKRKNKNRNFFFFLFFISISFGNLTYGLRTISSIAMHMYGSFLLLEYKKKGIFNIFLANITHFMTLLYDIILCISIYIVKNMKVLKILFYVSSFFVFMPPHIVQNIIRDTILLIPSQKYHSLINTYIDGYWGIKYLNYSSFRGIIYIYLLNIKYIWLFIYVNKFCFKSSTNVHKRYLCLLTIVLFFLFPMPKLRERYIDLPFLMSIVLFARENNVKKLYVYILIITSLVCFFIEIFKIREALTEFVLNLFKFTFLIFL